jgi:hypothetical protein
MEDFIFAERTVNPDAVHLRLLRDHDVPATNPFNLAYRFGLQDRKQEARNRPGERQVNGALAFDFTLKVKKGRDPKLPL